ncbi:Ger(x)C family spore germination protein [Paenisporosarcina quisquiliarum]|uniref:Ger(X)C family spore germination protein n=1 Tax=Paenisporosarcina quisquiliarum TaxID=365346 RepID=A0A9X3RF65_9BACL|nr:Ger(x)C family spore germination protein [Paenisporosarcina quisquiliarum]MCZ8538337.1 Ger(x)C family spore germination protein [Paenisporosarcina quisquiliarum]
MRNSMKFILILLFVSLMLAGCKGKSELNEILIVSSIGIDQEEDETVIHLQVVNPSGQSTMQGGGSGGTVYTYTERGRTIYEAVKKVNNILPRKAMFSHMTCMVVGEEYARESGIAMIFDFVERNNQIRDNVLMLVAKNSSAKEILSLYTPIFKNPAESLNNRVEIASATTGISEGMTEREIINWMYGDFRDPVILGVELLDLAETGNEMSSLENINANNKTYKITGLALFNKDLLTGWYDENQTIGWAMVNDRVKDPFIITEECENEDGFIGFSVKHIKSNVEPIIKDSEITFQVNISGTAVLQELTCKMDVSNPKKLIDMEEQIEASIKEDIERAVEQAKKQKVDVFGFGKMVYEKEPKKWKETYEKEWGREFANIKVDPVIFIRMESVGTRVNSIHEKD